MRQFYQTQLKLQDGKKLPLRMLFAALKNEYAGDDV
jgi:hypothetical protein